MDQTLKAVLIVGGVLLALLIAVPLLGGVFWTDSRTALPDGASGMMGGGMMGGGMMGQGMMGTGVTGGFGGGWFMPIVGILFFGLAIWAVFAGIGALDKSGQHHADSALDVLKKRYARGEISRQEFEEKKRDLA